MTTLPPHQGTATNCWNRIGIAGDRSCPELSTVVLCHNCPVYADAARAFFDRAAPTGYLDEWARLLSTADEPPRSDDVSVLLFRLGGEWLALGTLAVVEVTTPRPVHHIPHRSSSVLVGMVNLRGQLHLMVSLHGLLGVETEKSPVLPEAAGGRDAGRFVVIRQGGQTWVFAAEAVRGVKRFNRDELGAVPSNLANPAYSFSRSVVRWKGHSVGLLDDQRVFAALKGVGHE